MGQKNNLCVKCKKAYGGCSWTEVDSNTGRVKFQPIPGWTATKRVLQIDRMRGGYVRAIETYHITDCPLFEKEERA